MTRQVLANYSAELQAQATDAWRAKDRKSFQAASTSMLGLIRDLDELLATRPEYLLGNWLEEARRWGENRAEKDRLEWNARRVLTMWGEQTQIRDYSRRQWSGMLTGFYLPRWEKFFAAADAALASGGSFDAAAFDRELQDWERRWADRHESYPTRPRGRFDQSIAAAMGEISPGHGQAVCARGAKPGHRQAGHLFERPAGTWRRLGQRWQAEQHGKLLGHGRQQRQRPVVAGGPRKRQ